MSYNFFINLVLASRTGGYVTENQCVDRLMHDIAHNNGMTKPKEDDANSKTNQISLYQNFLICLNDKQYNVTWFKRRNIGVCFFLYNFLVGLLICFLIIINHKEITHQ